MLNSSVNSICLVWIFIPKTFLLSLSNFSFLFFTSFYLSFFLFLSLPQPNGSIVDRLGTPGGGAPLRTVSGNHVKTHLNTAKIIHFQDRSRPEVENVMRYEKSPHDQQEYANDLSNTCHPFLLFDFVRL